MANKALTLENTPFSDIPRSNDRVNALRSSDVISYAFGDPESPRIITTTEHWICATGILMARKQGTKIEAMRVLSPGFPDIIRPHLETITDFHSKQVDPYHISPVDPELQTHRDNELQSQALHLAINENSLAFGTALVLEDNSLKAGFFYATNFLRMGADALRAEIARHSFTHGELVNGAGAVRLPSSVELEPMQERHLRAA